MNIERDVGLAGGVGSDQFSQGAHQLKSSAESGRVVIGENAGVPLLRALSAMRMEIDSLLSTARNDLSQEPKLGTTPAAQVIKPYTRHVADGGDGSFVPTLRQFSVTLAEAEDAIRTAMGRHRETDEAAGAWLRTYRTD